MLRGSHANEKLSTVAALLNTTLLLSVLKYQSVHPEWAFWALLALGATELGLATLAARRRRIAFVVLATLGSAFLVAAFPFRYSGSDLSVLWLVGAETFLLAGVFTREIVFRRIGMLTLAIVSAQMIFGTGAPLLELRLSVRAEAPRDYATAVLFAVGAFLSYLNAHWVRARWADLFRQEFDSELLGSLSYVGGLLALLGLWFAFPGMWTAPTSIPRLKMPAVPRAKCPTLATINPNVFSTDSGPQCHNLLKTLSSTHLMPCHGRTRTVR